MNGSPVLNGGVGYFAVSTLFWFCQLGFSPDSGPSRCWSVAHEGRRDAANLSEYTHIHAWRHKAQVTCEGLTINRVIELHKTVTIQLAAEWEFKSYK